MSDRRNTSNRTASGKRKQPSDDGMSGPRPPASKSRTAPTSSAKANGTLPPPYAYELTPPQYSPETYYWGATPRTPPAAAAMALAMMRGGHPRSPHRTEHPHHGIPSPSEVVQRPMFPTVKAEIMDQLNQQDDEIAVAAEKIRAASPRKTSKAAAKENQQADAAADASPAAKNQALSRRAPRWTDHEVR